MEKGYVGPSGTPPNIAASSITASSCSSEEMPPHFLKRGMSKTKQMLFNVSSDWDHML
jgi:hypothetical protein